MDRRTIVFIIIVSIVFLGLNLYFNRNDEPAPTPKTLQKELSSNSLTAVTHENKEPTLIEIYADSQGTQKLGYGVPVKGTTLALSWSLKPPQVIYVKTEQGFQVQTLITKESAIGSPIVYASSTFTHLEIASLPEKGLHPIVALTFSAQGQPQFVRGEYKDSLLTFPHGTPSSNSLILYQTPSGEFLPFGFYEAQGRVLIELQNLSLLSKVTTSYTPKADLDLSQKYYVLENAYQQLVFTNVGGSIYAINLPFESSSNHESVVKEIAFDRDILKTSPANAHFPEYSYYTSESKAAHVEGHLGGYYPLLRRSIAEAPYVKPSLVAPQYYALNIISDYPEMAELIYEVKEFTSTKIVFEASQPQRKITKTFVLSDDDKSPYCFDLFLKIEGDSRSLWLTSGVPEVEIMSNSSSPQIQYRLSKKGKSEVDKLDLPKPDEVLSMSSLSPDWVVNSNGYLGIILDPLSEGAAGFRAKGISGKTVPTRLTLIDAKYQLYKPASYSGYQVLLPLQGGSSHLRIFAGPFEEGILKAVDNHYANKETGYTPNYSASRTFYGWFSFISEPFAKLLFIVMSFFHKITHSWAASIILLTIFLRLILYPLNAWSFKSMRRMQLVSPQVQALQAKYKKEPKKAQAETMKLYREKGVNPFTGCLPILIQIPFLVGMFDLLKSSFQLRGARFIPGWIDNLTAPDVLFQWHQPIFFIGNQFHLLPILLGAVMYLQQSLSSKLPKDRSQWTDQQRQQKVMGNIMTVVFTVMFYHFPSGLNLYWLSSMLLGIFQQWFTNRMLDKSSDLTLQDGKTLTIKK